MQSVYYQSIKHIRFHNDNHLDDWGWSKFSTGNITNFVFDADHTSIIQQPNLKQLSQTISKIIIERKEHSF